MVVAALGLIYFTYFLRALRWKLFLRPVCDAQTRRLIAPTFIGFTGLALLGRPGEFIRPYIIARKEGLSVSSQIGVWVVERIFDLGAYAVLAIIDIFLATGLPRHAVRVSFLHVDIFVLVRVVLIAMTIGLAGAAYYMRCRGENVAAWLEMRLRRFPKAAIHVSAKARALSQGLNTIHDGRSFAQLIALSLGVWFCITLAYLLVVHAYPSLNDLPYSRVMLLVGFSMVGGIVQLPAIGGGSQLATIAGLMFFGVDKEVAIGCGILLWLVTFVAVTPTGLALARREHVSIRKLTAQSHAEEAKEEEEQAATEHLPVPPVRLSSAEPGNPPGH
jgi:uncharacterized protein (TIRG00374 family)